MTIADKIRSILTIKSQVKAAIAAKGGLITDTTPFIDYPSKIQALPTIDPAVGSVVFAVNKVTIDKLILPTGVINIPQIAFKNLTVREIVLPNTITTISSNAIQGSSVEVINMPTSLTSLDDTALGNAVNLKIVTLPNSCILNGLAHFIGCSNLDTIYIGDNGMTALPQSMASSCFKLVNLRIPTTITKLQSRTFYNCYILPSFNFSKITSMGSEEFAYCSGLLDIDIRTVKTMGNNNFNSCTKLKTASLDMVLSGLHYNTFMNCSALDSLNLNQSTGIIGGSFITGATKLKQLYFPNGIYAFSQNSLIGLTGLKYMRLGNAVTSISGSAFANMSSLEAFVIETVNPPPIADAFFMGAPIVGYNSTLLKIYVPDASVNAYKAKEGWMPLAPYIKPMSEFVMPVL